MKVLQVTHTFLPDHIGGREIHVSNLSRALTEKGIGVQIITCRSKNKEPLESINKNPQVIRTPMITIPLAHKSLKVNLRVLPFLPFGLMSTKADIIHAHDYYQTSTFMCALTSFLSNKPLIISIHSCLGFFSVNRAMLTADWLYNHSVGKLTLKQPLKVIFMSKYTADDYLNKGLVTDNQAVVIHPSIDATEFNLDISKLSKKHESFFARKLGLNDNLIILSVGRVEKRKGLQYAFQAMPDLLREFPKLKLVIIGPDSGYVLELKQLAQKLGISENIYFTGRLSDDEVKEALFDADVYITPSESENFPEVLLKAAAFSKPIVASDTGGIPEFIKDGKTGLLVKVGDIGGIFRAIKLILMDTGLAKSLGGQASNSVFKEFTMDQMAQKTMSIYKEVLRGNEGNRYIEAYESNNRL